MDKLIIPAGDKEQIEVYSHIGPFDKGIAVLNKEKLAIWTASDLAEARMLGGAKHPVSREWSWVGENFNYLPDGDILVASRDYNPILKNPEQATDCHRSGKEFYLDKRIAKDLRERAEKNPEKAVKSGVLLLPRNAVESEIPSTALKDEPLTRFLFRDTAKPYGQFLKENGINSVPVYVVDADYAKNQKQALGRALWVGSLIGGSGLHGGDDGLHFSDGRVRGVRRVPAERAAPKVPNEAKVECLENILAALKEGAAFNYNGTIYVPVKREVIERAK
ncbi:MAG: hypothetical protein QXF14_01665 [Candidatus Woesearchaeota archaeon]